MALTAVEPGQAVTGPGAPAWLRKCTWLEMTMREVDSRYRDYTGIKARTDAEYANLGLDPDEDWVLVACKQDPDVIAAAPVVGYTGYLGAWAIGDPPPQTVLDWFIARTRAEVQIPVQLGDSAPTGTPDIPWITQLDTWLWIDDTLWQPISHTSPSLFGTTVTVTATPTNVQFEDDDGHHIDCGNNTGTPFNINKPDATTDCSLTPEHSSRTGDRHLTSRITWTITYQCNQHCGTGTLAPYIIENTRPITTHEYLVIES